MQLTTGTRSRKQPVKQRLPTIEESSFLSLATHRYQAAMASERRRKINDLDDVHDRAYNLLYSHTVNGTTPQMMVRYNGNSNGVSLSLKLDFKAGQWTVPTITALFSQRLNDFVNSHTPLKRLHDRTFKEECDVVRRAFYNGVIQDVYYRNTTPFFPHPALMRYLAQWDRDEAKFCKVFQNG